MDPLNDFEISVLVTSLSIFVIYHLILYPLVIIEHPSSVQLTLHIQIAKYWLEKHRSKTDTASATLAVQTLRNTIVVAVFVGGLSFSVGATVLNDFLNDNYNSQFQKTRSIVLSLFLFGSFLCWVCVIRFSSHLGFAMGTLAYLSSIASDYQQQEIQKSSAQSSLSPTSVDTIEVTSTSAAATTDDEPAAVAQYNNKNPELTLQIVARESKHMLRMIFIFSSMGFRFLLISVAYAFMVFGPEALLASTVFMALFIFVYDHTF